MRHGPPPPRRTAPAAAALVWFALVATGAVAAAPATGPVTPPAGGMGPRGVEALPLDPRLAVQAYPGGTVWDLTFTPDGRQVVTVGVDPVVRLWDVRTGRLVREFNTAPDDLNTVAVSADGRLLAAGGRGPAVRVWDLATGEVVALLEPHPDGVSEVRFRADGTLVAGGRNGYALWDVANEKAVFRSDPDERSLSFTTTPDGRYAAWVDPSGRGKLFVYDLGGRRTVREIPIPWRDQTTAELNLSPDGGRVYAWAYRAAAGDLTYGWDVASGRPLELVPEQSTSRATAFAPDGRRAVVNNRGGAYLMDTTPADGRWRPIARLGIGRAGYVYQRTFAFSPDGRTVAVGTGDRAAGATPTPGALQVYDVPDVPPAPPLPVGGRSGAVSWDAIPVTVARLDGSTVPLDRAAYRPEAWFQPDRGPGTLFDPQVRRVGDGLDAAWWLTAVALMPEPGVLREVLADPAERYTSVVSDGRHLWVGSAVTGISVLDPTTGKVLARVDKPDGLPAHETQLLLHPLGPGRVLAAGAGGKPAASGIHESDVNTGWCAVVALPPPAAGAGDGPKATVRVVVREEQLPADWQRSAAPRPASAMRAEWLVGEPAPRAGADGPFRAVWVGMRMVATPRGGAPLTPLLRIDPDRLTWSAHNMPVDPHDRPDAYRYTFWTQHWPLAQAGRVAIIHPSARGVVSHPLDPAETAMWGQGVRVLVPRTTEGWLVDDGHGTVCLAGRWWYRIGLAAGTATAIGPGLEVDGERVWDKVSYYASGHGGLAALSQQDGMMYRFSLDPAKPAAGRATWAKPPPVRADDTGAVLSVGRSTYVVRGGGSLMFKDGVLDNEYTPDLRATAAAKRRDLLIAWLDQAISRLGDAASEDDRGRAGLTEDQREMLASHRPVPRLPPIPDGRRNELTALFAAYLKAVGQPGSDPTNPAAEPLLAAAEQAGRGLLDAQRAHVAATRAKLGPVLWQRLFEGAPDLLAEVDAFFPAKP